MPIEYDRRRPRVPVGLAERIDVLRGGVPYERWVRDALQGVVDASTSEHAQALRPKATAPAPTPAPSPARYVKPFNPRPKGKS